MTASHPFIELNGVSKSFTTGAGRRHVLRDVSLSVGRGEFVSIVGSMGSGKSTLLAIIAGLATADAGTVTVDGAPVTDIRRDMSVVFQNYSLLPWLSALGNVRLAVGAAYPDMPRADQRARAERSLAMVGLGHATARRPAQLSGGMRQRVAIARALVTDPALVLADEPTGNLDSHTTVEVMALFQQLNAQGITIILVTHEPEVSVYATRIVVVRDGAIKSDQPVGSRRNAAADLAELGRSAA